MVARAASPVATVVRVAWGAACWRAAGCDVRGVEVAAGSSIQRGVGASSRRTA
jgi:hypothetical protein